MKLNNNELLSIRGGALKFSASAANAYARLLKTLYDVGHALGSSIRRVFNKSYC